MKTTLTNSIKQQNKSTYDIVSKIPILEKYCTPEQKSFLNQNANCCVHKKNTLILHENFPAYNIFFVESGIVALWKENIFSKRQYIRFIKEGELFGYRGSAINNSTYRLSASAFEDSRIYYISKKDFALVLNENSELHLHIMLSYVKALENIETCFCFQITMNTREKIAEALLTIYKLFGCNIQSDPFCKSMPRKEIAEIAGISLGKTINTLSEFREEKIIDTHGSNITLLKFDKLKEIVAAYHE